jgi:hypothetical protein
MIPSLTPVAVPYKCKVVCARRSDLLKALCDLAVIARREIPLVSVADAMPTLAVVEAVREAARTGARVFPGHIMEQVA